MKKRWTAALMALLLAAALLPAPARAAAPAGGSAGSRLTGAELEIYQYLKTEVTKIAKGTRTNTEIRIPDLSSLSWSIQELGVTENGQKDVLAKLKEAFSRTVDIRRVYDCLTADCPYELFWAGSQFSWDCTFSRVGERTAVKSLTIRLEVAQDYQGGSATAVSPSKIAAANQVVANAQAIVDKHKDESDYEKLISYREEICSLTAYNTTAAREETPYGNPWQLIYVFDGDPQTNVVCEGYAKAFKYLCDLSDFDGTVVCRTVTGKMGAGGHMWNVVQMGDGKNYLVDVTNCDSGTIGADDKLFLTGAAPSEEGRTYTVSKGMCWAVYTYDEDQAGLYADGWLALSEADYVDTSGVTVTVGPAQTEAPVRTAFADVSGSQYYAAPVAWAVEREITNGTSETTFSPGQPCTHGQILTFLWRAAGEPGDASLLLGAAEYYAGAVHWASELGMLGEEFDPEAGCSRADAVQYIWRALDGPEDQVASFTDVPSDASYAHAVGWAVLEGVTTGTSDDTFEPDTICNRGQIVTFLYRAYH